MSRARAKEFGDFQTPLALAQEVARTLGDGFASIVEPTCGEGAFLEAAARTHAQLYGFDISRTHLRAARDRVPNAKFEHADFFSFDWAEFFAGLRAPILVLGNPPWVTSAEQGKIGGINLPRKNNFQEMKGLDALTGKSNFDVSEWMLLRLIDALIGRDAVLALLIKTSVARRVLAYAWKHALPISDSAIYTIDAAKHFDVAVSACLFSTRFGATGDREARMHDALDARARSKIGWRDDHLVADTGAYDRAHALRGPAIKRWRSGIKHDAAAIFELTRGESGALVNGLGEHCELEEDRLFPLMKATELARGRKGARWILIAQKSTGEDTEALAKTHPKTWHYLDAHGAALDRRKSSIYKNRPRFSIFGVGEYSFAPWKVAISGLHKSLDFRLIGPRDDRPVLFDDTCYFAPCTNEQEGERMLDTLTRSRDLLTSMIFWDAKRPITAELLNRVDLTAVDLTAPLRRGR